MMLSGSIRRRGMVSFSRIPAARMSSSIYRRSRGQVSPPSQRAPRLATTWSQIAARNRRKTCEWVDAGHRRRRLIFSPQPRSVAFQERPSSPTRVGPFDFNSPCVTGRAVLSRTTWNGPRPPTARLQTSRNRGSVRENPAAARVQRAAHPIEPRLSVAAVVPCGFRTSAARIQASPCILLCIRREYPLTPSMRFCLLEDTRCVARATCGEWRPSSPSDQGRGCVDGASTISSKAGLSVV